MKIEEVTCFALRNNGDGVQHMNLEVYEGEIVVTPDTNVTVADVSGEIYLLLGDLVRALGF